MSTTHNRDQRVGVFVDVQNLYHSAKHLYNARVNFAQLLTSLVGPRKLIRAVAYVVKSDQMLEGVRLENNNAPTRVGRGASVASGTAEGRHLTPEAAFFDALEKSGMELRVKDLQIFPGGAKKADWDVGLAVDAIRMASFLDVIILVTGDGDFVPLVEYLKWGLGRQVEVASFSRSTSSRLRESTDVYINLEDDPSFLLRSRPSRARAHKR